MQIRIINELNTTKSLSKDTISEIDENRALRLELVEHFENTSDRDFAINFLNILKELRQNQTFDISGDILMLACLILGKHNRVEDSLKIWKTKEIDWDTHCYIDIQLVLFAGVQKTLEYLKSQNSKVAKDALEYITGCIDAGDFDDLENYYKRPWFV